MKTTKLIFPALALAILALAGCGHGASESPYGAKGVDWYAAHNAERAAQLKWCGGQSNQDQVNSQGCAQAGAAAQKAWLGQTYKSPF